MRVLIATVTAGGGHLAAAEALDQAWRAMRPEDQIERLDLLTFFSPLHRRVYSNGYLKVAGKAPEVWGMVFRKTDSPKLARRLTSVKRVFPSASRSRFNRHLQTFDPDVVLCTHYLPLETLGSLRSESSRPPPAAENHRPMVVSIVTDFEAHALWMDPCVDLYCVAAEQTKTRLVARGADPSAIIVSGIPISARFSEEVDQRAVRKNLGLRDDLPLLLVLSGGFGMGPVATMVAELDKANTPFQMLVITGRNAELRAELAVQTRKHPTHVLGFASNMHELMAVADLIVSKPGGLTTSEAMAIGKPLFIINPIPGQEAANSDFLLEQGAGAKANAVEDLPFRIDQLLGSKKLAEMARTARKLGRPRAATTICEAVMKRMGCPAVGPA